MNFCVISYIIKNVNLDTRLTFFTAPEGLEPPKCRNQNPVPYQLGDGAIYVFLKGTNGIIAEVCSLVKSFFEIL